MLDVQGGALPQPRSPGRHRTRGGVRVPPRGQEGEGSPGRGPPQGRPQGRRQAHPCRPGKLCGLSFLGAASRALGRGSAVELENSLKELRPREAAWECASCRAGHHTGNAPCLPHLCTHGRLAASFSCWEGVPCAEGSLALPQKAPMPPTLDTPVPCRLRPPLPLPTLPPLPLVVLPPPTRLPMLPPSAAVKHKVALPAVAGRCLPCGLLCLSRSAVRNLDFICRLALALCGACLPPLPISLNPADIDMTLLIHSVESVFPGVVYQTQVMQTFHAGCPFLKRPPSAIHNASVIKPATCHYQAICEDSK
jgi:hypothetical protein